MNCPQEIALILTELIQTGFLEIRSAAWAGDSERCAAIADHLHTVPELLEDFSEERLKSYWDDWRPQFCSRVGDETSQAFEPIWDRLRQHVEQMSPARSS